MPLVVAVLNMELRKIMDKDYPAFVGFPPTSPAAAARWAQAVFLYAQPIIPPSTQALAAKSAMQSQLSSITHTPPNGDALFRAAFAQFALILAGGMAPAFTATPPVVPIDLSSMYALGNSGANGTVCANQMATLVDLWFRTGIAVPSGGGPPIPWS